MNNDTPFGTDKYEAIRALQELDMNRTGDTDLFPMLIVRDEPADQRPMFLRKQAG